MKNRNEIIETFISTFNNSIELPDWTKVSLIDVGSIRFYDGFIGVFRKTGLEKYKLTFAEVIYFEHSKEACRSAEQLGITTYFYDHIEHDLIGLKGFLDNNV